MPYDTTNREALLAQLADETAEHRASIAERQARIDTGTLPSFTPPPAEPEPIITREFSAARSLPVDEPEPSSSVTARWRLSSSIDAIAEATGESLAHLQRQLERRQDAGRDDLLDLLAEMDTRLRKLEGG